jgi:hypothetical protein
LTNKGPDFSRVVRLTIDEALEDALGRLSDAIARLRAVEREAIERERTKLESLRGARLALEKCDTHLANLLATPNLVGLWRRNMNVRDSGASSTPDIAHQTQTCVDPRECRALSGRRFT